MPGGVQYIDGTELVTVEAPQSGSIGGRPLPVTPIEFRQPWGNYVEQISGVGSASLIPPAILAFNSVGGARIVNYATAAVTLSFLNASIAVIGTDYVPAAVDGIPGQWNLDFPLDLTSAGAAQPVQIEMTAASGNLNVSIFLW
jgi:hypothetical protein